ncbi:unnamed protein product [Camellia sinensis]
MRNVKLELKQMWKAFVVKILRIQLVLIIVSRTLMGPTMMTANKWTQTMMVDQTLQTVLCFFANIVTFFSPLFCEQCYFFSPLLEKENCKQRQTS